MNARSNIPDYQHAQNLQEKKRLEALGFSFDILSSGYFVRHNGAGLGGASTGKKTHGRYAEANRRDNLAAALSIARAALKKAGYQF